jgi:hypothetical protein
VYAGHKFVTTVSTGRGWSRCYIGPCSLLPSGKRSPVLRLTIFKVEGCLLYSLLFVWHFKPRHCSSIRNEYQETSWGWLRPSVSWSSTYQKWVPGNFLGVWPRPSVSWLSTKCGILDVSQPYRPPWPVTRAATLLVYVHSTSVRLRQVGATLDSDLLRVTISHNVRRSICCTSICEITSHVLISHKAIILDIKRKGHQDYVHVSSLKPRTKSKYTDKLLLLWICSRIHFRNQEEGECQPLEEATKQRLLNPKSCIQ